MSDTSSLPSCKGGEIHYVTYFSIILKFEYQDMNFITSITITTKTSVIIIIIIIIIFTNTVITFVFITFHSYFSMMVPTLYSSQEKNTYLSPI